MSLAPWDIYARSLEPLGYGYPLWGPEPSSELGHICAREDEELMAAYRRRALAVACARRPPWDVLRPEAAICVVGLPKTYRVMTRVCGGMHHAGVHTVLPRVTVLAVMLSSRLGGAGTCALRSEAVWAPLTAVIRRLA